MKPDNRPVVLLDIDDTILDFHRAESAAIAETFARLGIPADGAVIRRYSDINQSLWELLEQGRLTRPQVLVGRFTELFDELGVTASPEEAQRIYEELLAVGHYFMPGAEAMLEELDGEYRLFICSNGSSCVQAGRIKSAGIARYFENIFISEEIGFDKPDANYFRVCFSRIPGFEPDRAIVVGDSLTSDIRGGRNAGITTCWYNPRARSRSGDCVPDWEIDSLNRLRPLLDGIFVRRI